jgi:hypothetical protein
MRHYTRSNDYEAGTVRTDGTYLWNEDSTVPGTVLLWYDTKIFTAKLKLAVNLVLSQEEPSGSINSGTNLLSNIKKTNIKQ